MSRGATWYQLPCLVIVSKSEGYGPFLAFENEINEKKMSFNVGVKSAAPSLEVWHLRCSAKVLGHTIL